MGYRSRTGRVLTGLSSPLVGSQKVQMLNFHSNGVVSAFRSDHPRWPAMAFLTLCFGAAVDPPAQSSITAPSRTSATWIPVVVFESRVYNVRTAGWPMSFFNEALMIFSAASSAFAYRDGSGSTRRL